VPGASGSGAISARSGSAAGRGATADNPPKPSDTKSSKEAGSSVELVPMSTRQRLRKVNDKGQLVWPFELETVLIAGGSSQRFFNSLLLCFDGSVMAVIYYRNIHIHITIPTSTSSTVW
jgi:hypothetical protein